jgi:hypothetical protein
MAPAKLSLPRQSQLLMSSTTTEEHETSCQYRDCQEQVLLPFADHFLAEVASRVGRLGGGWAELWVLGVKSTKNTKKKTMYSTTTPP